MSLPDAPLPAPSADDLPSPWPLTLATYNIHGAVGADGRYDPARIAAVLREMNADVVALQEVPMGGASGPDALPVLIDQTRYTATEGPTLDLPGRRYGNAVLSRYPVTAVRAIDLTFGAREPRGALDADLRCHGHDLRVIATHLGLRPAERRAQIRRLLDGFDTDRMPVVLMGDVNEWLTWGRPLAWLNARFQRVPAPATFPARWPVLALDRIWIRPRQRLLRVFVHDTGLAREASDHLPLVAQVGG